MTEQMALGKHGGLFISKNLL